MKISPKKKQEILNIITSQCTVRKCPMCGGNNWNIEDKIFELREFNNGNLILGGGNSSIIPLLAKTCTQCGNTQFLNALMCGAIDRAPQKITTNPNNDNGKQ